MSPEPRVFLTIYSLIGGFHTPNTAVALMVHFPPLIVSNLREMVSLRETTPRTETTMVRLVVMLHPGMPVIITIIRFLRQVETSGVHPAPPRVIVTIHLGLLRCAHPGITMITE